MIHLQTLNKKELEVFVSSGEFQKYDFLPITEHRAKSQIKNPKAKDHQTLLILAFDEDQLAGYIGCLPDEITVDDEILRYAWLSTLFVSHHFRGKRIAQTLLNKAFEEYNGNLVLTEFTKEAESLYRKLGVFEYIKPKQGKRYYFRTDFETIIPSKKENTKSLKPIFKITDSVANLLISLKNTIVKKPQFKFEILDKIDKESSLFLANLNGHRNAEEINWAIENPWVLEGEKVESNYLFSSYSKQFKYYWIKIFNKKNEPITCSLLMIRDGHLKIPYLFTLSDLGQFVDFLNYFTINNKIKLMTSYSTELNKMIELKNSLPNIHERNVERRYMLHQKFVGKLQKNYNPNFQDGDGDCLMT